VVKVNREMDDPLSYAKELLESPSRAAAWIIYRIWASDQPLWNGLAERDQDFLPSLFQLFTGIDPRGTLFFYKDQYGDRILDEIRKDSWNRRVGRHSLAWLEEVTKELDDSWFLTTAP
jgi:hypothetical protein